MEEKKIPILISKLFREYERPETVLPRTGNVHEWVKKRRNACEKHGARLDPANIDKLTEDDVSTLLNPDENQTMDLRRNVPDLTKDMKACKSSIRTLTDESRNIKERFNEALKTHGMGTRIASLLLFLRYPEKCPCWSGPIEKVLKEIRKLLKEIGEISECERTETHGDMYMKIIETEKKLCSKLNADLVELDSFLWWISK